MIFNDTIVIPAADATPGLFPARNSWRFPMVLEAAGTTTLPDVIPAVLVQPHIQRRVLE